MDLRSAMPEKEAAALETVAGQMAAGTGRRSDGSQLRVNRRRTQPSSCSVKPAKGSWPGAEAKKHLRM